jgi:hypothetical protein
MKIMLRLRWSRCSWLGFCTVVRRFIPSRLYRIFQDTKKSPSCVSPFRGDVKPLVPCRRFAACKDFLNDVEVVISAKLLVNILAHTSTFRCGRGGTWRRKCEILMAGKSNDKLPLIPCPQCSVPKPYLSND